MKGAEYERPHPYTKPGIPEIAVLRGIVDYLTDGPVRRFTKATTPPPIERRPTEEQHEPITVYDLLTHVSVGSPTLGMALAGAEIAELLRQRAQDRKTHAQK